MLRNFLSNHVLANTAFAVVFVIGVLSYFQLPRAKDPEVNFNFISVITIYPGASAEDTEKLITDPLEEAIQKISDVKFTNSESREGMSSITIRFEDMDERTFDKRVNDLRREIQNKANAELPVEAEDPLILEITSSNMLPTATVVIRGEANDESLRRTSVLIKEDIENIKGVDSIDTAGMHDPELHVEFYPEKLQAYGITPTQLADSIRAQFRDVSAGDAKIGNKEWLVRLVGTSADPGYIARLPVIATQEVIPVSSLADVSRAREASSKLVTHNGKPAVLFAIKKKPNVNTLDMVDRLKSYIQSKNELLAPTGMEIVLVDDQTSPTRTAISTMEDNALIGLALVMFASWVFLGARIAFLIGLGIPVTLAGMFWALNGIGQTLNQLTLLGIVIVLGMLVDHAVVIVESIYYRLQRGMDSMSSVIGALEEVYKPVTSSVLTTIAFFLPLMILPGILGDFMSVVPMAVSIALIISLIVAFWILPVHILFFNVRFDSPGKVQVMREKYTRKLRVAYGRLLVKSMRRPALSLFVIFLVFIPAGLALGTNQIKFDFFKFDPIRLFYVNVEMHPGTELEDTLSYVNKVEQQVRQYIEEGEAREIVSAAGQMFTERAPFFGSQYGQITISLHPKKEHMREVDQIVEAMRRDIESIPGPKHISFMVMKGGPPAEKPISVKVRGENFEEIRRAADEVINMLDAIDGVHDVVDDDSPGKAELTLKLDTSAVKRSGLNPADVARTVRLLFDGEVVASMQDEGEKLEVRVRARPESIQDIDEVLRRTIALPNGGQVALGQLASYDTRLSKSNIRHYKYRRAITVEAELNQQKINTVEANAQLIEKWNERREFHPNVELDFSGELDDIKESLGAIAILFLFGIGLTYLILGAQFRSYFLPFMTLVTLPLAFAGVVYAVWFGGDAISMFTLYGTVALAGIAVNAAIVMIDAANARLESGMSVLHSTVYAARRRVVPIIITSLTTVAGLFSLATGLGGKSLIWGPVASAIVWGLAFSTVLTLFLVPMLYRFFMRWSKRATC